MTEDASVTHTEGTMPSVNDILAVGVIATVYFIRLASVPTPGAPLPWWLTVTTDAILPILAGAWVWAGAMYALAKRALSA